MSALAGAVREPGETEMTCWPAGSPREVLRERNNIDFTGIEFIPFEQQTARPAAALNFDLGAGIRDTLLLPYL